MGSSGKEHGLLPMVYMHAASLSLICSGVTKQNVLFIFFGYNFRNLAVEAYTKHSFIMI